MKYKVLGVFVGALFTVTAFAEDMKPGLWEVSMQTSALSGMEQQMASMSPAERQQMEAIMAQQGIKLGGGRVTSKVCITPEMAKRSSEDMAKRAAKSFQEDGNCTVNVSPRVGNTVTSSFTCTGKEPFSGKSEMTFQGDTAYSMQMRTVRAGQNTDMQSSGRWLGADCGNVKPVPSK